MYLNYDSIDRLFINVQDYTSSNDIIFCNQEEQEDYIQRDCINFCNENEIPYVAKCDNNGIKYFYFRSDLVAFLVKKRLELINILD